MGGRVYSELPKGKLSFEEVVSDLDFAIPKELVKKVMLKPKSKTRVKASPKLVSSKLKRKYRCKKVKRKC